MVSGDQSSRIIIPGYERFELLGSGGFSRVWKAFQPRFRRHVAIKILNFDVIDDAAIRQFERECQAMGQVSVHPNIVTVLDSGFTPDDRPFIVMEYFAGGSYDRRLADGPLSIEEALQVGVKALGALQTAHDAGVLHRDLKPHNIFVSQFGEPAIGDFGISTIDEGKTATGLASYTVHYSPPEVLMGRHATVQSDLYSLGATLFFLVEGQRPFDAGNGSFVTTAVRVATEPSPRIARAECPDALVDVIGRLMLKSPDERPGSAIEVAHQLQEIQRSLNLPVTKAVVAEGHSRQPIGASLVGSDAPTIVRGSADDPSVGEKFAGAETQALDDDGTEHSAAADDSGKTVVAASPPALSHQDRESPPNGTENSAGENASVARAPSASESELSEQDPQIGGNETESQEFLDAVVMIEDSSSDSTEASMEGSKLGQADGRAGTLEEVDGAGLGTSEHSDTVADVTGGTDGESVAVEEAEPGASLPVGDSSPYDAEVAPAAVVGIDSYTNHSSRSSRASEESDGGTEPQHRETSGRSSRLKLLALSALALMVGGLAAGALLLVPSDNAVESAEVSTVGVAAATVTAATPPTTAAPMTTVATIGAITGVSVAFSSGNVVLVSWDSAGHFNGDTYEVGINGKNSRADGTSVILDAGNEDSTCPTVTRIRGSVRRLSAGACVDNPNFEPKREVAVGQCIKDEDAGEVSWGFVVSIVDCESPHVWEVFATFDYRDGFSSPPEEAEAGGWAAARCDEEFTPYVGAPAAESIYGVFTGWTFPIDDWSDPGWRFVQCMLFDRTTEVKISTVGSAKASGK